MEDSIEEVNSKIKKAYCPEKIVKDNPVLDYCESIIFPSFGSYTINIKGQGPKEFTSYKMLESEYEIGNVHPSDLKPAVVEALNRLIQPVRDHFKNDAYARELLATIKGWNDEIAKKKSV